MPRVCFGCNAHLNRGEELLCTLCRNDMPLTGYTFNEENPVDRMFYGRIHVKKAASFLYFSENGKVQKLIHYLKYKNQEGISYFLGDWYGQAITDDDASSMNLDVVIPVPLHPKKQRQRGYNQVAGFAERMAHHLDAEYVDDILLKTANTKTQTTKGRIGRWQENKELYTLADADRLAGKRILLVDDVITTGATMEICARTLQQATGTTLFLASMAVVPKLGS